MAEVLTQYLQFHKLVTATGLQTVSGVGFQGKALIMWTTFLEADGLGTSSEMAFAMTDGSTHVVRYIRHPGGEVTGTSAQAEWIDHVMWRSSATSGATPTTQVAAEFYEFTADGFTLNWTTNDSSSAIIHAVVFGGADLFANLTQVKIDIGQDETKAVTGVGFAPTGFIAMGGAADEFGGGATGYSLGSPFGSIHGFGFANGSDNICGWTLGRGGSGGANDKGQHVDRLASVRVANLGGIFEAGELTGVTISSADADGYTVYRHDNETGHQPIQHILCLSGVQFAMGTFESPASASAYFVPLGFPATAFILQTHGAANTVGGSFLGGMGLAMGAWAIESNNQGGVWIGGVNGASPSVYRKDTYSTLLKSRAPSTGTVDLEVSFVEAANAQVELNFITVPSPADDLIYVAIGVAGACTSGGQAPDTTPITNSENWSV